MKLKNLAGQKVFSAKDSWKKTERYRLTANNQQVNPFADLVRRKLSLPVTLYHL